MTIFPLRKRILLLPYDAETLCTQLRKQKEYEVAIENNTFRMEHAFLASTGPGREPQPFLNDLFRCDFTGEFYPQGDSTQVVLKLRALARRRKILTVIISAILLASLVTFLIELLTGGSFGAFLGGVVGVAAVYVILYFLHFIMTRKQLHELKTALMKAPQQ